MFATRRRLAGNLRRGSWRIAGIDSLPLFLSIESEAWQPQPQRAMLEKLVLSLVYQFDGGQPKLKMTLS